MALKLKIDIAFTNYISELFPYYRYNKYSAFFLYSFIFIPTVFAADMVDSPHGPVLHMLVAGSDEREERAEGAVGDHLPLGGLPAQDRLRLHTMYTFKAYTRSRLVSVLKVRLLEKSYNRFHKLFLYTNIPF